MRTVVLLLALGFAVVAAVPALPQRIAGGIATTIDRYPFATSLLYSWNLANYMQSCGGTILTTRVVLTAAHCIYGDSPSNWRIRAGSTWANSGGTVYTLRSITTHPSFNSGTVDNDVGLMHTSVAIAYVTNTVQPASIAGTNYNLADNQAVYAIGWGTTGVSGPTSEQLRHVQIWSVNQATCRSRYAELGLTVTDNMLCSGWLDVGGRDQCQGDSGGPLIHNGAIVGICSWGYQCALPRYPGVNTRVSRFTAWIQANA